MNQLGLLLALLQFWPAIDLLRLDEAPSGGGLPAGWRFRVVRGNAAPEAELRNDGGAPVLRIHGAGRAAWLYRELTPPMPEARGTLGWSWRVLEAPTTSDLRRKDRDDSPLRVFVVFGNPDKVFSRSGRIIFYSFGNTEPLGFEGPSHANGRFYVIRVDGASQRGSWRSHTAAVFDDYRRLWGRNPPPVTAIGLMQDTDETRALAVAELRCLEWRPE